MVQASLRDAQGPGVQILRSFQFCKATIHVVDGVLWPVEDITEQALPDFAPQSFSHGGLRCVCSGQIHTVCEDLLNVPEDFLHVQIHPHLLWQAQSREDLAAFSTLQSLQEL